MRKGWKIFWIICLVLVGLGIVFCISGAVLGATMEGIRQVLGTETGHITYKDNVYTGRENAENVDAGDEGEALSMEFAGIRKLDIEVICPTVNIEEYAGESIQVKTSKIPENIQNDMVFRADNDELKIELKNRKKWINLFQNMKATLTIQIPEDYSFEEVSIEMDAGELEIENIKTKELNIDIGAGRAAVSQFTADEIELECGAGEADIAGNAKREIKIECGVGQVTYQAPGRQEDYNYELNCGIGDLKVGNDSYSGLGRETKIHNGGSVKMEIECGIGEVDVSFSEAF